MRTIIILLLVAINPVLLAQEHARILDHSTTYTINENQTAEIEEHYRIEILSEKGYNFSLFQEYFDRFRKINNVTVDIFDKNGKKVKRINKKEGTEFGFNQSYEITDGKILFINPDYKQYPFIVEVSSKVKLNGFISLPTWVPRHNFHLSVKQSTLTVKRPKSVKIKFREENIKEDTRLETEKEITSSYKVVDLAHIDRKIRYQDFYDDQSKVFISPEIFELDNTQGSNNSWKDFGNWFLDLNDEPYLLNVATKNYIDSLDKTDTKKIINNIYEYMQDKTRYVSIQLGIGGFKSLPTEDVEKFGYGDCKALTTYMKNMLDYAGIKSNYILVRAGNDVPNVLADFPGNQFNHVYLGIPSVKDTLYLECTSQISPTGHTGGFTDDRNVLWIERDKSLILSSSIYSHTENQQTNIVKIDLNENGNAVAEFDVLQQGIFFDEIMVYKMAPSDYIKKHNQSKFDYDDYTINQFTYSQPDRSSASFNSKYTLHINGLAKLVNDKLIIPNVPTRPLSKYINKDDLMKFYSIKRGLTVVDEIEVTLPKNYWLYNLPEAEVINSRYGTYKLSVEFDSGNLKIKRTIVLYKGDYKKLEYEQFKSFYQTLEKLEKRKLVLNSKT